LTATVIPLELVFEHRNYFPSVGLLLAVASLVALEPGLRLVSAKVLLAVGCIALFSFTTFLRAEEWSHPLRLAYSEALKRPQSPRAQYELARTLIQAAGDDTKSPLIAEATAVLERSAMSPGSGIAPLQALIFVNGRAGREIDPRWWQAILAYIRSHALSQTDIDSIVGLSTCQLNRLCAPQTEELLDVFTLALTRSRGNPYLLSAYADFALQRLGDADLAERMAREVVNKKPRVAVYRANLAKILLATGQPEAAEGVIADLAGMNHAGSLDVMILDLKARLSATKRGLPSSKSSPATVPESRSTR
jgi:tetratricopeptide (TPR) repeat protein